MLQWKLTTHQLDLKFTWTISRGSSQSKTIYVISVTDGQQTGLGEVAGITTQKDKAQELIDTFERFQQLNLQRIEELNEINLPSHLRFGIESAWIHLLAKKQNIKVEEYLKRKPIDKITTSFSLPILPLDEIKTFFNKYDLKRFKVLKLKVGHSDQAESCHELHRLFQGPIRVDANEAFQNAEDVLSFSKKINNLPIEFLEQPMSSDKKDEYIKLKALSSLPIFADESLQNQDIPTSFAQMFDGINIKLMKAGGYLQAIQQIEQAKKMNLKIMLGCMVETSLGISSALHLADGVDYFDLDGFLFFKDDPFNLVNEDKGSLRLSAYIP